MRRGHWHDGRMSSVHNTTVVYCLCAEWCGVCRQWRPQFDALLQALQPARLVWVDVDAQEEVLDILDIEVFPVLLIARDGVPLFCGPIEPSPAMLRQLLQRLEQPAAGLDTAQAERLLALLQSADPALH